MLVSTKNACLLLAALPSAIGFSIYTSHHDEVQVPFGDEAEAGVTSKTVVDELIKAEIIPTVMDLFEPTYTTTFFWASGAKTHLGNVIRPHKVSRAPGGVMRHPEDAAALALEILPVGGDIREHKGPIAEDLPPNLVVVMTDPDAPSRIDPKWSEFCHWIIHVYRDYETDDHLGNMTVKHVVPYMGPSPPPKTGLHRYVMFILAPRNETTVPLNLTAPAERKRWGGKHEREGVRGWMYDHGLVPIAANFFYAKH